MNPRKNDPLADLIGSPLAAPIAPPANYKPQGFTEACPKCRGRGRFISHAGRDCGPCFACKGEGKQTFKTSASDRAANRTNAAARKQRDQAAAIEAFQQAEPAIWAWMDGNSFSFAVAMREKLAQWGSLTEGQLNACRNAMGKLAAAKAARAEQQAAAPIADTAGVDRLKAAFDHAIAAAAAKSRGFIPRLTIGGMTISPAGATSANPGALYVKSAGDYLGKIAGGRFHATRECPAELQTKVLAFVADPKGAAERYGIETGTCCVCNVTLTNKTSIERGIGPICARKFGW